MPVESVGSVMKSFARIVVCCCLVVSLSVGAAPAGADHRSTEPQAMDLLFESPNDGGFTNSDLAFWGDLTFAGNYGGFRIFDVADPADPSLVADVECFGPQGDVTVWDPSRRPRKGTLQDDPSDGR